MKDRRPPPTEAKGTAPGDGPPQGGDVNIQEHIDNSIVSYQPNISQPSPLAALIAQAERRAQAAPASDGRHALILFELLRLE